MLKQSPIVVIANLLLLAAPAWCQQEPNERAAVTRKNHPLRLEGSQRFPAFQVIGNVYYVGAKEISAYIIETNEGLILLDTGTNEMHEGIVANVRELGFDLAEIKVILSSHAHWDHVEGHARMKKLTGAQVMAVGQDAAAIASGIDNSAIGAGGWEPAKVDRVLEDGDTVELGGVTMSAHLTAGHTKGCTTWTMSVVDNGRTYRVVFVGGTSINPGVRLNDNKRHPSIAADYARTFSVLRALRADVFLAQHPQMFDMVGKRSRMLANADGNPFVDPAGYREFVQQEEAKYVGQLQLEAAEQ